MNVSNLVLMGFFNSPYDWLVIFLFFLFAMLIVAKQLAPSHGPPSPAPVWAPAEPQGDSRKGSLLAFSVTEGQGVIAGDDGNRYTFPGKEWASAEMPRIGQRVDFVADGKTATGVYLDVSGGARASGHPFVDDPECPALYRSSDENMVGGVCAGLARNWNVPVAALRIVTVLGTFLYGIALFGYIACWIILPQRRTKALPPAALTKRPSQPPPLPSHPPPLPQSKTVPAQDGDAAPGPRSDGS